MPRCAHETADATVAEKTQAVEEAAGISLDSREAAFILFQ